MSPKVTLQQHQILRLPRRRQNLPIELLLHWTSTWLNWFLTFPTKNLKRYRKIKYETAITLITKTFATMSLNLNRKWTNFHEVTSVMLSPVEFFLVTYSYLALPGIIFAPRTRAFANVIYQVAHSSIRDSCYDCFKSWEKESLPCIFLSSGFNKNMSTSLQGLLARPSTATAWTKSGEVRTQNSVSSRRHARSCRLKVFELPGSEEVEWG